MQPWKLLRRLLTGQRPAPGNKQPSTAARVIPLYPPRQPPSRARVVPLY